MTAARRAMGFFERHSDSIMRFALGLLATFLVAAFALAWNTEVRVTRIETQRTVEAPYIQEMREEVKQLIRISTETQAEVRALRNDRGN